MSHAQRNLAILRATERASGWYYCDACAARYRGRGAAIQCCSDLEWRGGA